MPLRTLRHLAFSGLPLLMPAAAAMLPLSRASAPAPRHPDTGFLVLAKDRGFLGNEAIREQFDAFAAGRNAQLAFVTDERTKGTLDGALDRLVKGGARRTVVLPLFLSAADPALARAKTLLQARKEVFQWARPYGESAFAVEALADRLKSLPDAAGRRLILTSEAPEDAAAAARLAEDLKRIAAWASEGLGLEPMKVVVSSKEGLAKALEAEAEGGERPAVLPFHLGRKLDGMMGFEPQVKAAAPHRAEVLPLDPAESRELSAWMGREANRALPGPVGVVLLAHGSDHHWNETMQAAVEPLKAKYLLEPALCMADPPVVARAVSRLEQRGATRIVIVRVFGMEQSFQSDVARMMGEDVEAGGLPRARHGGHGGHHHSPQANRAESAQPIAGAEPRGPSPSQGPSAPAPRLRTSAALTSAGGLEDHPLFAQALADRARALSKDPSKETLFLVAHGSGDDRLNQHWERILASLAERMKAAGAKDFRAVRTGTWREDWPEQRQPQVERLRREVKEAGQKGGRALVIPARTLGQGFEKSFLEGLTYELGEGFAPHPLFAAWFEGQVQRGLAELEGREGSAAGQP